MSVERLTSKRDWIEAGKDLSNEWGYSHIWRRLKQIEDILGDTYDLDRIRELVANPPRLDRSAWEPCEKCRSCFSCAHVVENMKSPWNTCFLCNNMSEFKPVNFCPNCGRPLTDAAWEMLEKRLEGAK